MAFFDDAFWAGGPRPGCFYPVTQPSAPAVHAKDGPVKHTTQPSVTGTSVLGLKFNGGVVVAADMCGSYGSLSRFQKQSRLTQVGENCVVGAGGDMADFHALSHMLEDIQTENDDFADGHTLTPRAIHSYITRVMYSKRSKMEPLWNTVVVGGVSSGVPFLGYVDKIGVAFEDNTVASGYGAHIAIPLMRAAYEANPAMSEDEAVALLQKCLQVLFYRDARSVNRYEIAIVTATGVRILPPIEGPTNWDIAYMVRGYE
eukprot:m.224534 g.224534  ORF g.224534 m.224534 type:complete len:258 (-) comp11104_c0_seq1:50-823(-)